MPAWIFATWALGHLALSQGRPRARTHDSSPLSRTTRREAICEPGAIRFVPDASQRPSSSSADSTKRASCSAGTRQTPSCSGVAVASPLHVACRVSSRRSARRPRGSGAAFEEPSRCTRRSTALSIARARSWRSGVAQRRMKRRREARATLEEALGLFERIGAALWAERSTRRVEADQRARSDSRRPHASRGARRRARRRGQDEQGGRRGALRLRSHGRGAPCAHLRKARHPASNRDRRACASNTGDQPVKYRGLARFSRAFRSLASAQVVTRATRSRRRRRR